MMYVKQHGRGMKTLSQIFESRGDPWVTERQRAEEFPVEDNENPDLDRYFCRRSKVKRERRPDKPLREKAFVADGYTRGVNMRLAARKKMAQQRVIKIK